MAITNTTQLSLFDSIKTLILADSILSKRFISSQIIQYEPKLKNVSTKLPYILITVPSSESERIVVNNCVIGKENNIIIEMVNEYTARSNVVSYCNALIDLIEQNQTTFTALGYKFPLIDLESSTPGIVFGNDVIVSTFNINTGGVVVI